jgi:hypothetical protein
MMIARKLHDRLKRLTDALIEKGDLDAARLASVLVAAQDSIENGDLGAFALRVWRANQAQQEPTAEMIARSEVASRETRSPATTPSRWVVCRPSRTVRSTGVWTTRGWFGRSAGRSQYPAV